MCEPVLNTNRQTLSLHVRTASTGGKLCFGNCMCYYEYPESSVIVVFCILRELYNGEILSLEHTILRNTNNPLHHELLWYGMCFNAFQIQNKLFQTVQGLYLFVLSFFWPQPSINLCSMAISRTYKTKQHNPAQILKDITILHLFLNSQVYFKSLMVGSTQTNITLQALLCGALIFIHTQSKKFHEF